MNELEKKKPGLPTRLTPMQRKFAEILVFNEGHKFAYECAKEAGYEGDNATHPNKLINKLHGRFKTTRSLSVFICDKNLTKPRYRKYVYKSLE